MKRSLLPILLVICLLLSGCTAARENAAVQATEIPLKKFSASFYDCFDTVTQLIGFAPDEETFQRVYSDVQMMMRHYHQIFDGYNAYDGVKNLYYVNQNAGKAPVEAEPELMELLIWARDQQKQINTPVNIAMGAVLSVWHEYRTEGLALPPMEELENGALHTAMEDVILDSEKGTVYFADPALTLDLGAVAKGYTVEIIASRLLTEAMPSYIINAGGNVRCGAQPRDGRKCWGVGIQDPGDGKTSVSSENMDILYLKDTSVVTSGDYQRFYEVDGERYHHIIDPVTLMPSRYLRAVTVVTQDSGLADLLSTTLFLMPYEEGRALVDGLENVEAYWVLQDRTVEYTEGMKDMLLSAGASAI